MAPVWVKQCFWGLAAAGGLYVVAILALTIPPLQRNATYAHNVNPSWWQNLSNVEQFGFVHHQVQPFTIKSTDNVTIHAWHILPTHLYRKHKADLVAQSTFGEKLYQEASQTLGLRLLLENPSANVVVSFHGNAAHLASAHRPATYQQILGVSTPEHPMHVIAFDYRGFGRSTGTPTERGVIDDSVALLSALCGSTGSESSSVASAQHLAPSQVILLGQSLGTFVSTATFHKWSTQLQRAPFKALILVASFSSLPKLLDSYSIKGLTPPILSPLTQYPWAQKWLRGMIRDKWDLANRLQELLRQKDLKVDVTMVHAKDDWEIPYREGYLNWLAVEAVANGTGTLTSTHEDPMHPELTKTWISDDGMKRAQWEKVRHGGHNRIPTSEHLKLVLYDILDRV